MTTALATTEAPVWTKEDVALIREMFATKATDSEFKLFLRLAEKFDLDPFAKQIWCVKYGDKPAAIYASRDGFLHIAHRSGLFDGMKTVAEYDKNGKLVRATCSVWRKDMSHPIEVDVPLSEYNTNQNQWAKMPETMLKKVAESQALRRAFNVSGMYAPEEMDQRSEGVVQVVNQDTGEILNARTIAAPKTKTAPAPTARIVTNISVPELEEARRKVAALEGAVLDAGGKLTFEEDAVYGNKDTHQGGYNVEQLHRYATVLETQLAEITTGAA